MRRRSTGPWLLKLAWLPLVLVTIAKARGENGEQPALQPAPSTVDSRAVEAGASMIVIDQETGEILSPTAEGLVNGEPPVVSPGLKNALSTSGEGLEQRPNPAPAGGVMIDLRGRFQSVMGVTIGPDGKPVFHHGTGAPGAIGDEAR